MTKGTLYMVATPIGNLEDITLRALRILGEVDLIAAEDTRRTRKLLSHYGIHTPLTSFHGANEREKISHIVHHLDEGRDVACVSDAGTPGISDPGYLLVRMAIENDVKVVAVPGPAAAVTALSVSGLPMESFVFFAFLPNRTARRRAFLKALIQETKTMVFYESPRRLAATLRDMEAVFGDRHIVIARELTKIFEELLRGTPGELLKALSGRKEIKGEVTLIVSGAGKESMMPAAYDIEERWRELSRDGALTTKDIVNIIMEETHASRREVYTTVLQFTRKHPSP